MDLKLLCVGVIAATAVFTAAATADEMADATARLKIGQEALAATPPDFSKAQKYCDAAIGAVAAKVSDEADMLTADATECEAKALIGQSKSQEACDMIYPMLDMIAVSKAPGKADAKARLRAVLDPEVAAKRCK